MSNNKNWSTNYVKIVVGNSNVVGYGEDGQRFNVSDQALGGNVALKQEMMDYPSNFDGYVFLASVLHKESLPYPLICEVYALPADQEARREEILQRIESHRPKSSGHEIDYNQVLTSFDISQMNIGILNESGETVLRWTIESNTTAVLFLSSLVNEDSAIAITKFPNSKLKTEDVIKAGQDWFTKMGKAGVFTPVIFHKKEERRDERKTVGGPSLPPPPPTTSNVGGPTLSPVVTTPVAVTQSVPSMPLQGAGGPTLPPPTPHVGPAVPPAVPPAPVSTVEKGQPLPYDGKWYLPRHTMNDKELKEFSDLCSIVVAGGHLSKPQKNRANTLRGKCSKADPPKQLVS